MSTADVGPARAGQMPQSADATGEACCGVTACCTDHEHTVDPGETLLEAKTITGCGCVHSN
ncbi:hypothetical protein GCM10009613_25390 [Pseudonocardia kongjuensis]|uniref:Uncharacterized protein n=1 Tax=Pseudonocardia kongjuensis TaxID=102227 RepID=A0ABN1XS37_9PSEU